MIPEKNPNQSVDRPQTGHRRNRPSSELAIIGIGHQRFIGIIVESFIVANTSIGITVESFIMANRSIGITVESFIEANRSIGITVESFIMALHGNRSTQDPATKIGGKPDLILLRDPLGPLQRQPLIGE